MLFSYFQANIFSSVFLESQHINFPFHCHMPVWTFCYKTEAPLHLEPNSAMLGDKV